MRKNYIGMKMKDNIKRMYKMFGNAEDGTEG